MLENVMKLVSLEALSDILEISVVSDRIDLGPALLVHGKSEVIGDFICVSTSEGSCALIQL